MISEDPMPQDDPHTDEPLSNSEGNSEGNVESKSQRKRNAHQITELAGMLVRMKPKVLAALPLDPTIREAIEHCAEIKAHGARKRQLHFVSKLLRDTDNIQDLQSQVLYPELAKKKQAVANPHLAFRDRLLEDFAGCAEDLREHYPNVELQRVRQLVRNANNEFNKLQAAQKVSGVEPRPDVPQAGVNATKSAKSLLKLLTAGG